MHLMNIMILTGTRAGIKFTVQETRLSFSRSLCNVLFGWRKTLKTRLDVAVAFDTVQDVL